MSHSIPSGTVTFLFTDIEGSTKKWEQHPDAMKLALKRHDEILKNAIESHSGYVFKTVGDAFYAVFSAAQPALAAALDAQKDLVAESWSVPSGLRVRMALHSGETDERDDDFFGPAVNCVARVLAAGAGGQILLTEATTALLRDAIPVDVRLRSLGYHRLKDLSASRELFQLVHRDLSTEFPELKTLKNLPNNLPVQLKTLIGREKELSDLVSLLLQDQMRIVTVTGPGGIGKTRLALQAAADLIELFKHGVFFVDLSAVTQVEHLIAAIGQTLEVEEGEGERLWWILKAFVKERQILLVLDNFEQMVAAAPQVAELAAAAPKLKLLITTRETLKISGEHEFPVPPLTLPAIKPENQDPRTLTQCEAVRLFMDRATTVKPDFLITPETTSAIAEICIQLDGLPLAIELAAGRTKVLPPAAMLLRLKHRLQVLTRGARDLPARQQTMKSAIDWSYDLLEESQRKLFARISVFIGGFTIEAAESVCADSGEIVEILDIVESLIEKNLLIQSSSSAKEPRFEMLATIREYARQKLRESGEMDKFQERHAEYYLHLSHLVAQESRGPRQARELDRLEVEHANFRSALEWYYRRECWGKGLQLSTSLGWFWWSRGNIKEACEWLIRMLEAGAACEDRLRADAMIQASFVLSWRGERDKARSVANESLVLFRKLGDKDGIARAFNRLGMSEPNESKAQELIESALDIGREIGSHLRIGWSLFFLAQRAPSRASKLLQESVEVLRVCQDMMGLAYSLSSLSERMYSQGNHSRAVSLLLESINLCRELKDAKLAGWILRDLSRLAIVYGRPNEAAILLGARETRREAVGYPSLDSDHTKVVRELQAQLSAQPYERAWSEGRVMTTDQALNFALEITKSFEGRKPNHVHEAADLDTYFR